ncbi:MAG: hypothetical protein WB523_01180 [Candidatus Sulfotelmatobacter sp.]
MGKLPVNIEGQHLAANLCILSQQDGQSFTVAFDICDRLRKIFELSQRSEHSVAVPGAQARRPEGSTRFDHSSQLVFSHPRFKEAVNHLARSLAVIVADAHSAEQNGNFGMRRE